MKYKELITEIFEQLNTKENKGEKASYIPELAKVNSENFGVYISTINSKQFGIGDFQNTFSIQSIAKVFSLALAYKLLGEDLWSRLGVEPSGTGFNSLVQLESDNGIPRNPFINAGAIVIADILITSLENPKEDLLAFIRSLSANKGINYSAKIAASEKSVGYRNVALCNFH